jgi:acyl-ACP thioesterase
MQKFEKTYLIRSYETDRDGFLRIVTLWNILQDMADTHAENLGFGLSFCLKNNLTWFGTNYHVKINRLPKLHEEIIVRTWPSVKKKIGAVREFEVCDLSGKTLIVASSLWILIDVRQRKPVAIDKVLPDYQPLEERALSSDFSKISVPESAVRLATERVRFDDIDLNGHVNNAVYPLWATESMEASYRLAHQPKEIEINYKKECLLGESVEINGSIENDTAVYRICSKNDGRTLAELKIFWQEILPSSEKS